MTNKMNLAGRILLSGISLFGLLKIAGCETTPAQNMAIIGASSQHVATTDPSLSYQQSQSLGAMGDLLGILAQQKAMKEAAREGKSEVSVNVNGSQGKDIIYLKDGNILEGEIVGFPEEGNYIRIRQGSDETLIPISRVKNYINR